MKAVRYHAYGDTDVLVYVDAAIRAGLLQQVFPVAFPHVLAGKTVLTPA